ncbi:hypothetical protein BaRGS_00006725, partial [Batillaria attramentaria]
FPPVRSRNRNTWKSLIRIDTVDSKNKQALPAAGKNLNLKCEPESPGHYTQHTIVSYRSLPRTITSGGVRLHNAFEKRHTRRDDERQRHDSGRYNYHTKSERD